MPRIQLTSIHVDDQARALAFYTDVLGFVKKEDVPMGEFRWLTVVSAENLDGAELALEPDEHPAARAYCATLKSEGIPATLFFVDDVHEYAEEISAKGATIVQAPTPAGPVETIIIDDTCGNLICFASDYDGGDAA